MKFEDIFNGFRFNDRIPRFGRPNGGKSYASGNLYRNTKAIRLPKYEIVETFEYNDCVTYLVDTYHHPAKKNPHALGWAAGNVQNGLGKLMTLLQTTITERAIRVTPEARRAKPLAFPPNVMKTPRRYQINSDFSL